MAALLPNGYNPQSLQDALSQSAGSASANLGDQYIQAKKQLVSDQASSGRLMSGVSDYPLTDLQTQYQQGLSGIQGNLATEEAAIPSEDWLNQQQFGEGQQLASQLSSLLQPSTLDQVFQGIGQVAPIIGAAASFA